MQTSSAGAGGLSERVESDAVSLFGSLQSRNVAGRISFIPIILVLFYRVFLIVMPTQFIKQGSHSFGFRFIISHEKHFPMFGTIRGRIDAKFIHAEITRACPIFGPANPHSVTTPQKKPPSFERRRLVIGKPSLSGLLGYLSAQVCPCRHTDPVITVKHRLPWNFPIAAALEYNILIEVRGRIA